MKSSRELTFLSTSRKLKSKHEYSISMAYGSWQNFRNSHAFLALYRVKYYSLFLKSSHSFGRLSFHFLYDDILLFFFVVHQIHTEPNVPLPSCSFILISLHSKSGKLTGGSRFFTRHESLKEAAIFARQLQCKFC